MPALRSTKGNRGGRDVRHQLMVVSEPLAAAALAPARRRSAGTGKGMPHAGPIPIIPLAPHTHARRPAIW